MTDVTPMLMFSKPRNGRYWHMTPTVLPADQERVSGRLRTLCGKQIADTAREPRVPLASVHRTCRACKARAWFVS